MVWKRKLANGVLYYATFIYNGKQEREPVGSDKREALNVERKRKREIASGIYVPGRKSACPTFEDYASEWLERPERKALPSAHDDESRLRLHVYPRIGKLRLDEIRPLHVRDLVLSLRNAGKLAPKTIINIHGVLRTALAAARFEELIPSNPAAELPRGILPSADEPGPNKNRRQPSAFTRAETETLISDVRIPLDRRTFYGLMLLGGMRIGEAAGRRWRDYDPEAKPLGRLTVETQYNDRKLKTGRPRQVPVHPVLARMLAEWKLQGFALFNGRHPRADDWIVPSVRGLCRSARTSLSNLDADCELVGVMPRRVHDMRHTFMTLARGDGARHDVIERVSHNAKGKIIDHYTHFGWDVLCEAVSCLRIEIRRAEVVALPRASNDADLSRDLSRGTHEPVLSARTYLPKIVEAAGVETTPNAGLRWKVGESRRRTPKALPSIPLQISQGEQPITHVIDQDLLARLEMVVDHLRDSEQPGLALTVEDAIRALEKRR